MKSVDMTPLLAILRPANKKVGVPRSSVRATYDASHIMLLAKHDMNDYLNAMDGKSQSKWAADIKYTEKLVQDLASSFFAEGYNIQFNRMNIESLDECAKVILQSWFTTLNESRGDKIVKEDFAKEFRNNLEDYSIKSTRLIDFCI